MRIELETGVTGDRDPTSGDQWIEITNHRIPGTQAAPTGDLPWTPIDGTEQVILGDLSILADGNPVNVAREPAAKAAAESPAVKAQTK